MNYVAKIAWVRYLALRACSDIPPCISVGIGEVAFGDTLGQPAMFGGEGRL